MRARGRAGEGGRDWGNIDWSNIDLSGFGRGGNRISGPSRRVVFFAIIVILLLLIPLLFAPFVTFLTDLLWFRSLGLESVYLRRFTAGFYAFAVFGALFFVIALPNLYFALRPQVPRLVVDAERRRRGALSTTLRFMWLLLIPAFFFGLAGGDEWDMLLRYVNQVPFGIADPVFGTDIGFYFFTLPVLEFVRGWLLFFFSSRRRHTRFDCDWSSDVCSSDLLRLRMRHLKSPVSPSNPIHNADDCGKDYEGSGTEIVNASPAAALNSTT